MEKITFVSFNVILVIMLFFDFFLQGSNLIFIILLILLGINVLLNYYFSRNDNFKWEINEKKEALIEVLIATIIMFLIVIFYLLGGRSQHGLNPTGYVIWILYLFLLGKFLKDYKKLEE